MTTSLFFIFTVIFSHTVFAATDWSQPPVACVEDIVPKSPGEPCLDLTNVANPLKDYPAEFSESDIAAWKKKKSALQFCRYQEVQRRETLNPGSQSPSILKLAWMLTSAIENRDLKINAVYQASRDNKMPAQILAGALKQESIFSNLGIAPDGDNYSCGVGQINLVEWCNWIDSTPVETKNLLQWPNIKCSDLSRIHVKPFYNLAIQNIGNLPLYRLGAEHFQNISLADVEAQLPASPPELKEARYKAAMSFAKNCVQPKYGIAAKGYELARLYRFHIPKGIKNSQTYLPGESLQKNCLEEGYSEKYPLHMGWLLAVGMYNAGPGILNPLSHYYGWNKVQLDDSATFQNVDALNFIEGLYWGGKWDAQTDQVIFSNLNGTEGRSGWFKMCIVQRHIARVVQHATQEGSPVLADTLEGSYSCRPAKWDENGNLITSAPPDRQISSGKK